MKRVGCWVGSFQVWQKNGETIMKTGGSRENGKKRTRMWRICHPLSPYDTLLTASCVSYRSTVTYSQWFY